MIKPQKKKELDNLSFRIIICNVNMSFKLRMYIMTSMSEKVL